MVIEACRPVLQADHETWMLAYGHPSHQLRQLPCLSHLRSRCRSRKQCQSSGSRPAGTGSFDAPKTFKNSPKRPRQPYTICHSTLSTLEEPRMRFRVRWSPPACLGNIQELILVVPGRPRLPSVPPLRHPTFCRLGVERLLGCAGKLQMLASAMQEKQNTFAGRAGYQAQRSLLGWPIRGWHYSRMGTIRAHAIGLSSSHPTQSFGGVMDSASGNWLAATTSIASQAS